MISTIGGLVLGLGLVLLFSFLDRNGAITFLLHVMGIWGIFLSIFLMTLLSVFPIPSEFLLIINMKVYGVVPGIIFAWTGTMIGTYFTFVIVRNLASPLIRRLVSEENWSMVESWVKRKGAIGLLMARLLPIPAPVINYASGTMESISLWNFFGRPQYQFAPII